MYTLLKAIARTPDQFYWQRYNRKLGYKVVFSAEHANHFAQNIGLNDHLPGAVAVRSVLCSGTCIIASENRINPNEFVAFGMYNQRLYRIPGTFDHSHRIFMPKTGYLANPNQLTIHAYNRIVRGQNAHLG